MDASFQSYFDLRKFTFLRGIMLCFTLLLTAEGYAQETAVLEGIVRNAETKEVIPGAYVILKDGAVTSTDATGGFRFELSPGLYELTARMIGFKTQQVDLQLGSQGLETIIDLENNIELLQQVVVSAGRYDQEVAKVTVSMEIIPPQLIQDRNIITLDEALKEVPGMIIVDNEPQIRSGSGYSFGAGSRVQVLMDGIPQLSGDVGRPAWSSLPMEGVEQVEVIKGASSVLYGSAALSGVVHLRTTYPKEQPYTRIEYFTGAYSRPKTEAYDYWGTSNLVTGQTILHSQKFGHTDVVASLNLLSDDGHLGPLVDSTGAIRSKQDAFTADFYAAERWARAWMKVEHKDQRIKGLRYGLQLHGYKSISVATLLWDNIEDGLYRAVQGTATTTDQIRTNINPYVEYLSPAGNHLTYRMNWNKLDNDNDNDQGNFSDSYFHEVQLQTLGSQWGIEGMNVVTGLSYTKNISESQLFDNGGLEPFHESSNLGLYLQVDQELGERINLSGGLRWERFEVDGDEESKPVFRAGVNVELSEATFFRASYGQGFRFPTIGERFISTSVGAINIYPNPGLQAETSVNMELGIKQGFAIGEFKGFLDLAAFRQDFDNFIEYTFGQWGNPLTDPLIGLGFTSLNTGEARVEGLELSWMARGKVGPKSSLSLLAGYTYTVPVTLTPEYFYPRENSSFEVNYLTSSSDPANDILKYRMQHLVKFNADLDIHQFHIGAGLRYNSNMQNIDLVFEELDDGAILGGTLPTGVTRWRDEHDKGDAILDARIGYRFQGNNALNLIIDNALNREYAIRPLALERTRRIVVQLIYQIG